MATTNHEQVRKGLDLLREGLAAFVARELKGKHHVDSGGPSNHKSVTERDAAGLLKLIWDNWQLVFRGILGQAERSLVSELRGWRNKWAHQESISHDDAYRMLDSASRLLAAISAPQSKDLETLKMETLRIRFDEQTREVSPQAGSSTARSSAAGPKARPPARPTVGHQPGYIDIMEPLVLISIAVSFREGCDVYEAVRYAWKVDVERIRRYKLVLAHVRGSVKGAYRPHQWLEATSGNFPLMDGIPGRGRNELAGRYGFVGERAEAAVWDLYVGKRVPDRYLRQYVGPVQYCDRGA
ncbi:MAG: Swt1 family HEPN domain-containing protein [Deltaproteobacteria bacterium]|nr:Swt1 family HEPN domain-containing protein [Deltaproteobacteria bacterium]